MLCKDFWIWSESFERGWVKRESLIRGAMLQLQNCHWEQRQGEKVLECQKRGAQWPFPAVGSWTGCHRSVLLPALL